VANEEFEERAHHCGVCGCCRTRGIPDLGPTGRSGGVEAGGGAAATITELNVNGLKVLVKERPGSQTVAAGLFIRGGSRNVTAANAGIEA
jgi:hypothetical protein